MPVTTPEVIPAVATVVVLLAHVPPVVGSLNVVVLPWQTVVIPVMGVSSVTLTVAVLVQPADVV
jgi:hypothetical protein